MINENGQRLLELCSYHGLCVTNSYFQTKPQHRVSWRHPRSKHWHQLDLVIVRRTSLKTVLLTRSYHSADCDTDHSLVCSKFRLHLKKFHRTKTAGKPRIDTTTMQHPDIVEEFAKSLVDALSADKHATPLLRNGTSFGRPFRKQPLKPLGGRPPRTATGLKLSQM